MSSACSAITAARQGHWQAAVALLDTADRSIAIDVLTACALNPGLAPFMFVVVVSQ